MGKKIRCSFCNKKVGLINFTCKCEGIFCALHRYTHTHNCPLIKEKKEDNKKVIQKQNPKTESTTLEKIK
tara:strand:+ start:206 stop:415 length:210 start_codon:yes stop_codon:yes gene_type:complete